MPGENSRHIIITRRICLMKHMHIFALFSLRWSMYIQLGSFPVKDKDTLSNVANKTATDDLATWLPWLRIDVTIVATTNLITSTRTNTFTLGRNSPLHHHEYDYHIQALENDHMEQSWSLLQWRYQGLWRLELDAIHIFCATPCVQATIKENIKIPHYRPFVRGILL